MTGTTLLQQLYWHYLYSGHTDDDLECLLASTGKESFTGQTCWNNTIIPKINEGSRTVYQQIVDDGDVPPRGQLYLNNDVQMILSSTGYCGMGTYCDRYDMIIDAGIVEDRIYITANQYYVQLDIIDFN